MLKENLILGGRVFPGVHHHASFEAQEQDGHYSVSMSSDDGDAHVAVEGHSCDNLPETSIFGSLKDASNFFECGSLGYSATSSGAHYDGLELRTLNWNVEPLSVERVESSFLATVAFSLPGPLSLTAPY